MELSKKDSSIERADGEKHRKVKKSSSSDATTTKRSQKTTASSTRNKASTSRHSYTDISPHARSDFGFEHTLNTYQTSNSLSMPTRASQIEVDLLGLAPQTPHGYQLGEVHQTSFINAVSTAQSTECLYHLPILQMRDNVLGYEKNLDPMARWLAEGHTEQCALLRLADGQLSMHKECQCSNRLQPGMEMEIEE